MAAPEVKLFRNRFFFTSVFILLLAAGLRAWGIGFGLPHLYHADEPIVVNHALRYGSGDFNPHFFNIPPLASYALFVVFGLLFLAGKILGVWSSAALFADHFFSDPSLLYIAGRLTLGLAPAVFSIFVLMRWMKKCGFTEGWAALAGLFFAVVFSHVSEAHYIYTDMPLVLVCLLFFEKLQTIDFLKRGDHFKLGLLIGLAAAFKYNGIFLAMPYLWIHIRRLKTPADFFICAAVAAAGSFLAFVVLNPYALLDYSFFLQELREQSAANQGGPFLHHFIYSMSGGLSWPLVLLGIVGGVRSFFSKNIRLESISFFCFIYYIVLWQKGQPYGRYILPLVPFLIVLAVEGLRFLFGRFEKFRLLWIVLILFIIGANLAKDIRFDLIMQAADIRTQAKQWIEKNIPPGSRIALDGTSFTPRLNFNCAQLAEKQKQILRKSVLSSSSEARRVEIKFENCKNNPGYELYFLTSSPDSNPFLFASPELMRDSNSLKDKQIQYVLAVRELHTESGLISFLGTSSRLVQAWDPRQEDSGNPDLYDSQIITGGPFTWKDLFARTANGYRLELYAIGEQPGNDTDSSLSGERNKTPQLPEVQIP